MRVTLALGTAALAITALTTSPVAAVAQGRGHGPDKAPTPHPPVAAQAPKPAAVHPAPATHTPKPAPVHAAPVTHATKPATIHTGHAPAAAATAHSVKPSSTSTRPKAGTTAVKPALSGPEVLTRHPEFAAKISPLLPPGTTVANAAAGFRNFGQFVAAVHVSRNLGIPFDQLKARMTGPQPVSLGQAIQQLKPAADVEIVVRRAELEARDDLRER